MPAEQKCLFEFEDVSPRIPEIILIKEFGTRMAQVGGNRFIRIAVFRAHWLIGEPKMIRGKAIQVIILPAHHNLDNVVELAK